MGRKKMFTHEYSLKYDLAHDKLWGGNLVQGTVVNHACIYYMGLIAFGLNYIPWNII